MSDASKCDICGALYEPVFGCVTIVEVNVVSAEPPSCQSWENADFCPKCSRRLLDMIAPALNDLVRPAV